MITFAEIITIDPVTEEETPGMGFLDADGKIMTKSAILAEFSSTFGMTAQQFQDKLSISYDQALLSIGLIYANGPDIQVGMYQNQIDKAQLTTIYKYAIRTYQFEEITVLGVWYAKKPFALIKEEVIYSGLGKYFYASMTNPKFKIPKEKKASKVADIVNNIFDDAQIRKERIKKNRESITLGAYLHYGLPVITIDGDEYAIGTDEMADNAAYEAAEDSYDQDIVSLDYIVEFVNEERLSRAYADNDEFYEEQAHQNWRHYMDEDELEEGQEEPTDFQYEQITEKIKEENVEEIANDPVRYLRSIGYAASAIVNILKDYIDKNALVSSMVDDDGRGHFLNPYDGGEGTLEYMDMEVADLPLDVIQALGITYRYRQELYLYRTN